MSGLVSFDKEEPVSLSSIGTLLVELSISLVVVDVFLNQVDELCRVTSMLVTDVGDKMCW